MGAEGALLNPAKVGGRAGAGRGVFLGGRGGGKEVGDGGGDVWVVGWGGVGGL